MKKPYVTFSIIVTALLLSGTQSTIVDQYNDLYGTIKTAIDWGIIFIALTMLTLIVLAFRKNAGSIFRRWNISLGVIAIVFAAWGMLAFTGSDPGLGGTFGFGIIGARNVLGVLRILGLLAIGIFLFLPKVTAFIKPKKVAVHSTLDSTDSQHTHTEPLKDAAAGNKNNTPINTKSSPAVKFYCKNCGKELTGTPFYCRYCGIKAPIENKFCPTCGSPTYDAADFCTKCGALLR
jgi:Double zinc ribbon